MKLRIRKLLGLAAIAVAVQANMAPGASIAVSPIGGNEGGSMQPTMTGWEFLVSTPTHVSGLAFCDATMPINWWEDWALPIPTADGLQEPHRVGIWDAASRLLLVSATVEAGLSPPLVDGFRVVPISFDLIPGMYVIGADNYIAPGEFPPERELQVELASATNSVDGISYIESRWMLTTNFEMPLDNYPFFQNSFFGPSFVVGYLNVAEPGSLALLVCGLVALAAGRAKGMQLAVSG